MTDGPVTGALADGGAAPPGPPPAFWALSRAMSEEATRRMRRAFLIAIGVGLLAVFALGASILPAAATADLLLSYLIFLAAFSISLALALVRAWSGPYGDAIEVAEVARAGTMRAWEEAIGERHVGPLASPAAALAWLRAHPETERNRPQRFSAQLMAGDLAAARETLTRYPVATAFQRYWQAADAWFLDVLEGSSPSLAPVEAEVAAVEDPALRAHAESGVAALRAHEAHLAGGDWTAPLAAAHGRVSAGLDPGLRVRVLTRVWVTYMVIAAGLVGVALLVGRLTGVWGWSLR